MRSAWSLGFLMLVLGGMSVSGIGGHRPLGPVPWVLAGLLMLAGLALLLRRPFAFYVALGAAAATTVSGLVAWLGHPSLALPVPPPLSVGVGIYLSFRVAILNRVLTGPAPRRGFLPPPDAGHGSGGATPRPPAGGASTSRSDDGPEVHQ